VEWALGLGSALRGFECGPSSLRARPSRRVGGSPWSLVGGAGPGGQANAVRSRWKPSAMWAAQRQVLSMRRWSLRAAWVSRAATCRTR
jgi:hypothetical protein